MFPFILTCALIIHASDFTRFRLWTFQYAYAHSGVITFGEGINTMMMVVVPLFKAAPGLWSLAFLGLLLLGESSLCPWRGFIAGFAFFSFVAVWPGWRGHYFIQLLPAAGLLAGVVFRALPAVLARLKFGLFPMTISLPVFAVAMFSPLVQWSDIYFLLNPPQASRVIYTSMDPFPESVEVGRYLAAHSSPESRIAVLGSEPQIYFYCHRRAATGYICTFPLMEPQPYALQMQKEMIRQIEQARPDFVVFVHVKSSWWQYRDSNPTILDWFGHYQRKQLELVGLVEMWPDQPTQYHWFDQPVTDVQTSAESWLAIFKRRPDGARP